MLLVPYGILQNFIIFQNLYIAISLPCHTTYIEQILNSTHNDIESHNLFMLQVL